MLMIRFSLTFRYNILKCNRMDLINFTSKLLKLQMELNVRGCSVNYLNILVFFYEDIV